MDRLRLTTIHSYQVSEPGTRLSLGGFAKKLDFHGGYTYETPQRNTIAPGL